MFYIKYLFAELRRRMGRTLLTALGLGIGVALVISTTALSAGLDDAQAEVLQPLTGVGTDMSVTRPIDIEAGSGGGGPLGLSDEEQEQLEEENGNAGFGFDDIGDPGEEFSNDSLTSTSQLSFPEEEIANVAGIDGVAAVSGSLSLTNVHTEGKVPEFDPAEGPTFGSGGAEDEEPQGIIGGDIEIEQFTVTGIDTSGDALTPLSESNITEGRVLTGSDEREAVISTTYATTNELEVGDKIDLAGKRFTIVGLTKAPIGGSTTDVYVDLSILQKLSDREGRVNTLTVRAVDTDAVADVSAAITETFDGSEVTTAQDLADRVGGSLVDAENLVSRMSLALTVVGLLAAFLIASFLTLSSVAKRTRELGTLKAIGWSQRKIVRQVTLESLGQGLLGGGVGALIGLGAAAVFNAMNITMEATVAAAEATGIGFAFGPGGQAAEEAAAETTSVILSAPIEPSVLIMAVVLALLGGLIAGGVGSFRASRLRPAEALRTIG